MPLDSNVESDDVVLDISPAIFKFGTMLSTTFSMWTGSITLQEADREIWVTSNADESFYKPGSIRLVPKETLTPFQNRAGQMTKYLSNIAMESPIPYLRFVRTTDIPFVVRECKACRDDFFRLRDEFLNVYPEIRERRINLFNERHPAFIGRLDKYFPDQGSMALKFNFDWRFLRVIEPERLDSIMAEEQERFRLNTRNWLGDLASKIRQSAVEAALAFRQGMDRAKVQVDGRSVNKFKLFLERFETQNFMEDSALRDLMMTMKTKVFATDEWYVEDQQAMNEIKALLDQVVAIGSDEGAATEVARNFIRTTEIQLETGDLAQPQERTLDRGVFAATEDIEVPLSTQHAEMNRIPPTNIHVPISDTVSTQDQQ